MVNICECGNPNCQLCKQQQAFFKGRGVSVEDKNFLQDGPRIQDVRQANAFFCQPSEHPSANKFKDNASKYLSKLDESARKQASVFFGER